MTVYDPYKAKVVDTLTFEGITHNPKLHIGGVAADPYSNLITVVVDAAAAFVTAGKDLSGDNWIIKYDPDKKSVLWKLNITEMTGGHTGGFQDIETDARGNTYIVGTFPGTILRVDKAGTHITTWYAGRNATDSKPGYAGLAATGDILLANDGFTNEIHRFDMTADKGVPVVVPRTPNAIFAAGDAIYLPPKYDGKVLLVAVDPTGVTVLRSKDGKWTSAEQLGTIPLDKTAAQGGMVPAAVQIGDSLFEVIEFFSDPVVAGTTAGNRTQFPLIDITKDVAKLLGE